MNISVTNKEFLKQIPSDIHLRRLSMQYSINETKELAIHLGMDYQIWDDLYVTFGEEPERLKFEALWRTVEGSHLTFNSIGKAVKECKIQTRHSLCRWVIFLIVHIFCQFEDLICNYQILLVLLLIMVSTEI